jgi:UDP-N-acetylmuramoylalanine--D-glutamate ligase
VNSLSGQNVVILGAGASGRAAAVLALREGAARVALHDARGPEAFQQIPEAVECVAEATPETGAATSCDLLVVSPGIETGGPFVQSYAAGAGELIGEVELASRCYAGTIVAITGTNGKTTCTELVARILEAGGMSAAACGNYGRPFSDVVLEDPAPETVALEVSSFQLETISMFRPKVAVWLNFAPDHMDRYRTVEEYRAAKLRIFENQQADDVAVVRAGEDLGDLRARVTTFTAEPGVEADLVSDGREIFDRLGSPIMSLAETHMRGLHNAENTMAALGAGAALGVPMATMREALQGYAPPLHRCELVRTLDGVEYLNDSKATNLHALESALRSQDRPVVLIAGGKEKGLDYQPLLPLLSERAVGIVCFGQIGPKLAALCEGTIPAKLAGDLAEAVEAARAMAPRGSTVLFSPGTSSFDQFSGYQERGETFRKLVHKLK